MSGEIISHALGDISDDLLCGAMQISRKKRRKTPAVAAWVAAAVLLVVLGVASKPARIQPIRTAPGVITVLAHALDEQGNHTEKGETLEEGKVFYPQTRQESGSCQTFPLSFQVDESLYPGMTLTLQVSTTDGIFYKNEDAGQEPENIPEVVRLLMRYYGQEYETEVDRNVYWQTEGFDYMYMREQVEKGNYDYDSAYQDRDFQKGPTYIHVILRADGNIVGFCILQISLVDDKNVDACRQFSFQVIASVSYPQVDGAWQEVTQADVQEHIRELTGLPPV